MIKCPSCGYENVDGTQFCEGCGEELSTISASAPAASAPAADNANDAAPANMTKCPACDNLNPADNVVCEVCGTELHPGALGGDGSTPFDAAPVQGSPDDAAIATGTQASAPNVDVSSAAPDAGSIIAPVADSAPQDDTASDALADVFDAPNMAADPTAVVVDTAAPSLDVASTTDTASTGDLKPGNVKLVVEQGMTVGKQFVLGDAEIQVGREDDDEGIYPDIDLSDQDEGYVHRRHATLNFNDGKLSVTHLGGANKTRINNKPLPDNEAQPLNVGDKIAFGKVVMRVQNV